MQQRVYNEIDALACDLRRDCVGVQGCIVSLDGFDGSGKTSLAKRLAVELAAEHIELDSFLVKNRGGYVSYLRYEDLANELRTVTNTRKLVLVEGVCVQSVLQRLGIKPTVRVYVKQLVGKYYWSDGAIFHEAGTAEQAIEHEQGVLEQWDAATGEEPSGRGSIGELRKELIQYHFCHRPHETAEYVFQWSND